MDLSKEFAKFWSNAFSLHKKKNKFADKPAHQRTLIHYNGHPIRAESSIEPYSWKLSLYDPNDIEMEHYGVPFLVVGYELEGSRDVYSNDLGKTATFLGKELVNLALYLKDYFKIKEFILLDDAVSTRCPLDGVFCDKEAVMHLRQTGALLSGKGYYEALGAKPNHLDGYREAVEFLQNLSAEDLLNDIKRLEYTDENLIRTLTTDKKMNLSQLSIFLKENSTKSKEGHQKWHAFHDYVIANRGTSLAKFTHYLSRHKWEYDQELIKGLSFIVYSDIRMAFNELLQYLKLEKELLSPDQDFIVEGEAILDSYPNQYGLAGKWCQKKNLEYKLKNMVEKPSVFCLLMHTDRENVEKFLDYYETIELIEDSGKLFNDTVDTLKYILRKNDEKVVNYRQTFIQLAKKYHETNIDELPPGHVYGLWMYAKWVVHLSNAFEFGESKQDSKGSKWGSGPKGWFRTEAALVEIANDIL